MAIFVDDRELLAAHLAGDSDAFDEIVREHRPALHRHALRRLSCEAAAEDAVQETLVRAYKALPNFSGEYLLGPWMHRILQNVCADEGNRRKRDLNKLGRIAALPVERMGSPSVEEELHLDFDDSELQEALENLSDPYREALNMRYIEDLDYSEVSKAAGVSEQNARARVSRAKMVMKTALKSAVVFPGLLLGLLKKGEKVVAAATPGGAITSVAATATSVQVASSIPSLVEVAHVAAQAAPTAIPVIAKAAVGLGLAAAIFSPSADSAIHNAVGEIAVDKEHVIVSTKTADAIAVSAPILVSNPVSASTAVESSVSNDQTGISESNVFWASISAEGGSEDARESLSDLTAVVVEEDQIEEDSAFLSEESGLSGAAITSADLLFVSNGLDRYDLSGRLRVTLGGDFIEGSLESASRMQMVSELNTDGRQRIDGYLEVLLTNGEVMTLRMVGFGVDRDNYTQVAGLFAASMGSFDLAEQGSFAGMIRLNAGVGSIELSLIP
jgi:RNA polymerase sigma-70 factor (ECF subfamily)